MNHLNPFGMHVYMQTLVYMHNQHPHTLQTDVPDVMNFKSKKDCLLTLFLLIHDILSIWRITFA